MSFKQTYPRVIVLRTKYTPKTWKSCSDIKSRPVPVKKCCRYAKKTCPVLQNSTTLTRTVQSCTDIHKEECGNNSWPRRMSERDLPSRVDSERSIPASKSVPALHHISPGAPHDVFNPGYSRTSSSNSINAPQQQNGPRSRSTHNLNQQQDSGFYQNLSVYRNKMPSPQQLADRTSALRSSQNSLHSTNTQRPTSAYYPPAPSGPLRPHQSIPNLKSPSVQRLHNEDVRTGPYPNATHPRTPQDHPQLISPSYGGQRIENQYPQPQTQQPLITSNGQRHEDLRFSTGLLREMPRHEDMMRYPSTNNVRIQEAQIQQNNKLHSEELIRNNEMRTSKSEDMLRHHTRDEGLRYTSSSNNIHNNQLNASLRGQAKMAEMSEEVKRRQNRIGYPQQNQQMPYPQQYQQHQQQLPQQQQPQQQQFNNTGLQQYNYQQQPMSPTYPPKQVFQPMQQPQYQPPTAAMQNLSLNQSYGTPPTAPKPVKKTEEVPPELPPTSTHPLYSASSQEPPKGAFYPNPANQGKPGPANPWEREERERQMELRRQHARQWQEQQIQELSSMAHRSSQQEEQLRALRLEREFQRRAMEAAQDDEDTEKENQPTFVPQPPPMAVNNSTPHISPPSILKSEPDAPPPPERGSSYTVMSLRNSKRVSFNDTSAANASSNNQSAAEEVVREDPNSFILQAESMLASPTTPTDSGAVGATPGVIGAQEVYRDPRTRRLAEQAQQKTQSPIPEKLSFKEKMKMFAMETGEAGTPKDKSKISRAQREIDNLTPSSSLVH